MLTTALRRTPLVVIGVAVAALAVTGGGLLGLLLVVVVAGSAVALHRTGGTTAGAGATAILLVLPAAATAYFAVVDGGFPTLTIALGALLLLLLLAIRCGLTVHALEGWGPGVVVPLVALLLLAAWSYASSGWSQAPGRAFLETDRVLLYAAALALFGAVGRSDARIRLAVRWVAAAIALVATLALASRVAPGLVATEEEFAPGRLSFPLGYWNTLGVFCALGAVLCLHVTSSLHEPRWVRPVAAAALPILGATAVLTLSRGGIAAAIVAIAAYVALGFSRGLVTALLAAAPFTALAVLATYDATLLTGSEPLSAGALVEGDELRRTVLLCVAGTLAARALLLFVDARLQRISIPRPRLGVTVAGAAAALGLVVVIAFAAGVPGAAGDRYDEFVGQSSVGPVDVQRERLFSTSNQGRLEHWRVALEGFEGDPLRGSGARTFPLLWAERRSNAGSVVDAHSLYVEVLGELGMVGLGLLAVALLALLVGLIPIRRDRDRSLYAALFAATLAWLLHAGIDWDWEMPVVTFPIFALGGLALARRPRGDREVGPRRSAATAAVALTALALAAIPALVIASELPLQGAVRAFRQGDCNRAIVEARQSVEAVALRAEGHELVGLCHLREGRPDQAAAALRSALERDPDNWSLHYGLALAVAAAGGDPRPELVVAIRRNPQATAAVALHRAIRSAPRRTWPALTRDQIPVHGLSGRW